MEKLLGAFQHFFREHSEHWLERFDYKEAGPQLLLQAFLQRIINGGGRIVREYGLGRRRTDLLATWPYGTEEIQRIVLELKIRHGQIETTVEKGLTQIWFYVDRANADEEHLVIFDRSEEKSWDEKIFDRSEVHEKLFENPRIGLYVPGTDHKIRPNSTLFQVRPRHVTRPPPLFQTASEGKTIRVWGM